MKSIARFVVLFVFLPFMFAEDHTPAINGYVTRAATPTDFDVNGVKILVTAETQFNAGDVKAFATIRWRETPYIGEPLAIFGQTDSKKHAIAASEVVLIKSEPATIKGFGLIDRVLVAPSFNSLSITVRADGYPVLVDPKIVPALSAPLTSLADIQANVWIAFTGQQREDGVVVATSANLAKNEIRAGETKLRNKTDYDPAAVDPGAKQGIVHKAFLGWDPKREPPYINPEMQARVDRIGASLVPEYQRRLADSDPSKIRFRFQLIDTERWLDAIALPSGIILVPRQVVERMDNDSQLAAVLADSIAGTLQKVIFRAQTMNRALFAGLIATDAAAAFAPGLGLAMGAAEWGVGSAQVRHQEEQCERVGLGLLADAKYDIYQAPIAWWLLTPKKPKPITKIALPPRSAYLYQILGTTWRSWSPGKS